MTQHLLRDLYAHQKDGQFFGDFYPRAQDVYSALHNHKSEIDKRDRAIEVLNEGLEWFRGDDLGNEAMVDEILKKAQTILNGKPE